MQLLPAAANTPLSSISDAKLNAGIFVRSILQNPPNTGGTYIFCAVDEFTLHSYLAKWGGTTGLAKELGSTEVVPISLDNYPSLWPGYGDLMGEMVAFWGMLRENSWVSPLGTKPMRAQELMTKEDLNELQ